MATQPIHHLNEVSIILGRTPGNPSDLTSIMPHIAKTAQEAFGADSCVAVVYNPITEGFLDSYAAGDLQAPYELVHGHPRPTGITQQVLKEGTLLVGDLNEFPQYHNPLTLQAGIRAYAGIALRTRHRKRPLGVIYLDFKEPRTFSASDEESYRSFAFQASFLLQETWLARHYKNVASIGQAINGNLSTIDDLFHELQGYVDAVLDDTHTFSLAVYQPQANMLDIYMREHGQTNFFAAIPLQGIYQTVMDTQRSHFISHYSQEKTPPYIQNMKIPGAENKESFIFVPLMLLGNSLGILSIQHPTVDAYGREDVFILELLANYTALALHNMRLYNGLNQLNETGQLLTQQLESGKTLQATADRIKDATKADVVVLYPYDPKAHRFILPPRSAGHLLDSNALSMAPRRHDNIATMTLNRETPVFATQSTKLYSTLQGNIHTRQGNFEQREQVSSTAAIPLRVGHEAVAVGVLFINYRQPQRFDEIQRLLIEGLAHYAAIAIKNAQAFSRLTERRINELEILRKIDLELSSTLDLNTVLNTLLRSAHEHVASEEASVVLHDMHSQTLHIPVAVGLHADERRKQVIALQENRLAISRWVMEHKQPARVGDVGEPPWRNLYHQVSPDIVSELDVPLVDSGEVVGILNFESTRQDAFTEEDEQFLVTLAGQAVLAIKNAQAYGREKRLAEEGQVLNKVSREITSQLDLNRVFDLIMENALKMTNSTLGSLHLYDPYQDDFWMAAESGVMEEQKQLRLKPFEGIIGSAAGSRKTLNVPDINQPPWDKVYVEFIVGTRSELTVPMLAGDEIRGVLNIESSIPNHFSEEDERLLQGLADLAVVALQNAERYEKATKETQRFALLYEVGQDLSKITDMEQIEQAYDLILQIAAKHSQSLVVIRRYVEEVDELVIIRASDPEYKPLFPHKTLHVGINGQVAREKRMIAIHDTENLPADVVSPILSNPATRSLVIIPIMFKDRYYGNLGLSSTKAGYFRDANDLHFYETLAQQLATTIYRLETVQRAIAAEAFSSIGQISLQLTHRWGNALGLVKSYVNDIRLEMQKLHIHNDFIAEKLDKVVQAARIALNFSKDLKQQFVLSNKLVSGELAEDQPGKESEAPEVVQPGILLQEVKDNISLPLTIKIELDVSKDITTIWVVYDQIADIIHHLVTNAIEAMPDGGTITLRARNIEHSVVLEVTDTGRGIPLEDLPKIFDLFYSTKGSSGFGLWRSKTYAFKNHGELKVKSQLGQGTTFTLLLPQGEGEIA